MDNKNILENYNQKVSSFKKANNNKRSIYDWRDYMYLFIHQTASVEGNTFSEGDTKSFLLSKKVNPKYTIREHNELLDMEDAFKMMLKYVEEGTEICEQVILDYHRTLMKRTSPYEAGIFKTHRNFTRTLSGEIKYYPNPVKSKILFIKSVTNYLREKTKIHPILYASNLHYDIASAHPFSDGNGRLARLLFEHVMTQDNLPSIFLKNNRKEYISAIEQAQQKSDKSIFSNFIINSCTTHIEEELNLLSGKAIKKKVKDDTKENNKSISKGRNL